MKKLKFINSLTYSKKKKTILLYDENCINKIDKINLKNFDLVLICKKIKTKIKSKIKTKLNGKIKIRII